MKAFLYENMQMPFLKLLKYSFFVLAVVFAPIFFTPQIFAEKSVGVLKVEPGEQPKPTLAVKGARSIIFTRVRLTAVGEDVLIRSLTIKRTGAGQDTAFSSVGIEDIGDSGDLNTILHTYVVKAPFTLLAGDSIDLELKGNMKSSLSAFQGQMPKLSLVAIDTDAKIEGKLPIEGTAHTINSNLVIGTMNLSKGPSDPPSDRSVSIFEKNVILNSLKVTIGNAEAVKLKNMYWIPNGSMSDTDLKNITAVLLYNGKTWTFPATPYIDGDGTRKYRAKIDQKVTIDRGGIAEIYIKGDFLTGVGRTIRMKPDKFNGIGADYGYEIRDTTSRTGVTFTVVNASMDVTPSSGQQ